MQLNKIYINKYYNNIFHIVCWVLPNRLVHTQFVAATTAEYWMLNRRPTNNNKSTQTQQRTMEIVVTAAVNRILICMPFSSWWNIVLIYYELWRVFKNVWLENFLCFCASRNNICGVVFVAFILLNVRHLWCVCGVSDINDLHQLLLFKYVFIFSSKLCTKSERALIVICWVNFESTFNKIYFSIGIVSGAIYWVLLFGHLSLKRSSPSLITDFNFSLLDKFTLENTEQKTPTFSSILEKSKLNTCHLAGDWRSYYSKRILC